MALVQFEKQEWLVTRAYDGHTDVAISNWFGRDHSFHELGDGGLKPSVAGESRGHDEDQLRWTQTTSWKKKQE